MTQDSESQGPKQRDRVKVLGSEELFSGAEEVVIRHKNEHYRLLVTKAGKLILNK